MIFVSQKSGEDKMQFYKLSKEQLIKKLPALYSQSEKEAEDVIVPIKLFNPTGSGTWYLTEYDPEEDLAFGYCHIHEGELGYIAMEELRNIRVAFGLRIEVDTHWEGSSTLRQVMDGDRS
jgi:hypothetical protein